MSGLRKFTPVLEVVAMLLVTSRPAHGYQSQPPVFPVQLSDDQVSLLKGDVAAVMQFSPEKVEEECNGQSGS